MYKVVKALFRLALVWQLQDVWSRSWDANLRSCNS